MSNVDGIFIRIWWYIPGHVINEMFLFTSFDLIISRFYLNDNSGKNRFLKKKDYSLLQSIDWTYWIERLLLLSLTFVSDVYRRTDWLN